MEILLGFWARSGTSRRAALVLLWIGFFAMLRGMQAIVVGFEFRGFGHSLDTWASESGAASPTESGVR